MNEIINIIIADFLIKNGPEVIRKAREQLKEHFGKGPIHKYEGAEDFWYRGIEQQKLTDGANVRITGLLSPLAPYMPSHPRVKPGYSAEGWDIVSEKLKTITGPLSSSDDPLSAGYDVTDLFVWGDSVIRHGTLPHKKIYAGLYNQYGKSFECVPVFIDESNSNQKKALDLLDWWHSYGGYVTISGEVRKMASFYENIGVVKPQETPKYPCYTIEVSEIKVLSRPKLVLYATGWLQSREGVIATEFFKINRDSHL